jgi:hypothetical protein
MLPGCFSLETRHMVMTKAELIGSLQNEVRILVHLAGKVDPSSVDYRPTPKQRSSLELLRYMSIMGPALVAAIRGGAFDVEAWTAAEHGASNLDFDQAVAAIGAQDYAALLGDVSDAEFRQEIEMFGRTSSKGSLLVNLVLCGYAAYRTQLFCYLKACGRQELSTMNLWAGMDPPVPA